MRESYGGAWLFGLVITFMVIFVGFLAVMISYATTFKTKNEVVAIIEKYEGIVTGDYDSSVEDSKPNSIWLINTYLKNVGYANHNTCSCASEDTCYGLKYEVNRNDSFDINSQLRKVDKNSEYYYCINFNYLGTDDYDMPMGYFDVELFFNFDIPIINAFSKFSVKGQTNKIKPVSISGLEGLNL